MLSFVVPVFDEEESIEAFHKELTRVAGELGEPYEIVFVDDGSRDKTLEILKSLRTKELKGSNGKDIRIYSFQRNHGKAEALTFGFQRAEGDTIVTLDADLQDKPTEIEKLLKKQ